MNEWSRVLEILIEHKLFLCLKNQTDMQAFIGFVNFYCHFIQDFSTIA